MRSIRVLYTVAVLSLAGLFLVPDPFLHGIAAVLLIVGALPMFRLIFKHGTQSGKEGALTDLASDLIPPTHQDTPQSATEAQDLR